jgi:phospholipase/carboxylesterase
MNTPLLDCIEIGAEQSERSIIWLHGLGANGHDFEPIAQELNFAPEAKIRFVFPNAPHRNVTVNAGVSMPAWYDIRDMDFTNNEDNEGIRTSQQQIEQLIENEQRRGVKSQNIILAGFSQGGAIALQAGLRFNQPLAGIMALSTYLPLANTLEKEASGANKLIPIFQAHGTHDPVVPISWAEDSRYFLKQFGYSSEFHTYRMEHGVHPDEIQQIKIWILKTFGLDN